MVILNPFVERYKRAVSLGMNIVDLDPPALAGYYISTFPGDPVSALLSDIEKTLVAVTVGLPAKMLILASLRRDMLK